MDITDSSPWKPVAARSLAATAAVLTLLSLYVLPWWPPGRGYRTFLQYRAQVPDDLHAWAQPWWHGLSTSWVSYGFAVQTVAVLVLPFTVTRRDWRHLLSASAVLCAV